nr:helix-turn-helix transcriptional regulator [Nocardioides soli]
MDHLVTARNARGGSFAELTERERDVLELVSRGYDNPTIARVLALSSKTVRNYLYSIFAKVGVVDRGGLVALALDEGVGVRRPEERGPRP